MRRFAHGKPAIVLVAERVAEGAQLSRFAAALEPHLGFRPDVPDVPELFRLLFRLAGAERSLIVIDEFPYMLPSTEEAAERALTAVQAVFEEEQGDSRVKLILCGSQVAQMEELMAERSPLRGRLRPLQVTPLRFDESAPFVESHDPVDRIERFAIAGGVPRYLAELGAAGTLRTLLCERVLDRRARLFNEPREIVEQELRSPEVYFSILELLAGGDKRLDDLAGPLRIRATTLTRYLLTLQRLRLVERRTPITAGPSVKGGHYRLADPFFRFWFRFVFPHQADLEAGLDPRSLYDGLVRHDLPDHVALAFEEICRAWTRREYGTRAQRVGVWWGKALNELRRKGTRTSEEIDVVGLRRGHATVLGECRWRAKKMGASTVGEIEAFKLPALRQGGVRVAEDLQLLLFSRAGFTDGLHRLAQQRGDIRLVTVEDLTRPPASSARSAEAGVI